MQESNMFFQNCSGGISTPYRIWWIPQVPMKPFVFAVDTVAEGALILKALAAYDIFQVKENVKPDCCNAGGLDVWMDDEWITYYDDDGLDVDGNR